MKKTIYRNTSDISDHELRLRSLSRCLVRFVVEKYGGTLEIDPHTDTTAIDVPYEVEEACLRELQSLMEYAYT